MIRVIAACALALTGLTGCAGDDEPAAAPTPAITTPAAPSASAGRPGEAACTMLGQAVTAGTLLQPGVVDAIAADTASATPLLRAAGQRLAAAYGIAVAAKGTATEKTTAETVTTRGADMKQTCAGVGFPTG
jgi:hypothetical protein